MGNVVAINACGLTRYAFAPLPGGGHAFGRTLSFAAGLQGAERIVLLGASSLPEGQRPTTVRAPDGSVVEVIALDRASWSLRELVGALVEIAVSGDLFYLFGDCPLYDPTLARRMYEHHERYYAEYTFADAYPLGLSPEILKGSLVRELPRLLVDGDTAIQRDSLFTLIQRDINAFDIETVVSPVDLRLLRIQLSCDTRRNYDLTRRIMEAGALDEAAILDAVKRRGDLLRTLPAYVEIQITDGVTQRVSYSPYPKLVPDCATRRNEMAPSRFRLVAKQLSAFCEDATVSLSLWGEPALHSQLPALLAELYRYEGLSALIETSGVGWRAGVLEEIAQSIGNRITWIVDLDAATRELYLKLRGEGWEEAHATCERLLTLFPGKVHVQAVRMTSNEADLEAFYQKWKGRVPNVIIQKYDWFAGYLPQLKVTDLSPIRRLPCWHLKRDLVVLLDGTVPMCREDLAREHPLGNLFEEELAVVWGRGQAYHERHVAEDYPAICRACDEYYTFNF